MKRVLFQARLQKVFVKGNRLLLLCSFLLLIVLCQALALLFKEERIVIIPAELRQECWVGEGKVSDSYLEEMALFLANFCLSASPGSIEYQKSLVLKHAHPSHYGALRGQFLEMERLFKKQGISTHFRPVKATVFQKINAVDICGDFYTWVGSKQVSVIRQTWRLTFALERGRLFLLTFQKKEVEA